MARLINLGGFLAGLTSNIGVMDCRMEGGPHDDHVIKIWSLFDDDGEYQQIRRCKTCRTTWANGSTWWASGNDDGALGVPELPETKYEEAK